MRLLFQFLQSFLRFYSYVKKNVGLKWTEIFFLLIVFIFGARGLKAMNSLVEVEHKFMNTFSQVILPFLDQIILQAITFSATHPLVFVIVFLWLLGYKIKSKLISIFKGL